MLLCLHVLGNSCVMFRSEEVQTGFVGIALVVIFSSLISMSEVES